MWKISLICIILNACSRQVQLLSKPLVSKIKTNLIHLKPEPAHWKMYLPCSYKTTNFDKSIIIKIDFNGNIGEDPYIEVGEIAGEIFIGVYNSKADCTNTSLGLSH